MITISEARERLTQLALQRSALESTTTPVETAVGRFLSQSVDCEYDSPMFDQSAMDGLAFRYEDLESGIEVAATVAAGDDIEDLDLKPNQGVRIMTGAPLPDFLDTVEMKEQLDYDGSKAIFKTPESVVKGRHIRYRGENLKRGEQLFPAGERVTPAVLSALLSQGIVDVAVKRKLQIGIGATGDEIISHRCVAKPGQVFNSNEHALTAALTTSFTQVSSLRNIPDDFDQTAATLEKNAGLDMIILTGGVSAGDFDFVPEAAKLAGFKEVFHKVRIKPGKPLFVAVHESGCVLFGLPGNPVSAITEAETFIKPYLWTVQKGDPVWPISMRAPLAEGIAHKGPFPYYRGANIVTQNGVAAISVRPISGSGDIVRFAGYDAFAILPPKSCLNPQDLVEVLLPLA